MMNAKLPYIPIDEEISLNLSMVVIIMSNLSISSKNNYILDFDKLQIFLYLVKNPAKINSVLSLAGKGYVAFDPQYTHTVESKSTNVDILFYREKLRSILKYMAAHGLLKCHYDESQKSTKYYLSGLGKKFSASLDYSDGGSLNYFEITQNIVKSISPLASQTNTKLNQILNLVFKGI